MNILGLTIMRMRAQEAVALVLGGVLASLRVLLSILTDNISTFLFVAGIVVLYVGVADLSPAAANIVLGVLLIAISVWPYVKKT